MSGVWAGWVFSIHHKGKGLPQRETKGEEGKKWGGEDEEIRSRKVETGDEER